MRISTMMGFGLAEVIDSLSQQQQQQARWLIVLQFDPGRGPPRCSSSLRVLRRQGAAKHKLR
jgi:hypothetical protein